MSSIGVLGSSSIKPLEETAPHRPYNPYTSSKAVAEQLLSTFAKSSGLELVILRPPAVLGAGVKGNIKSLVWAVKLGFPLPFSCLANQRQFVTLQNLLEAIKLTLSHRGAAGQVFHVANSEKVSTSKMCELIAGCLNMKSRQWPLPAILFKALFKILGRPSLGEALTADFLVSSEKISKSLGWRSSQSVYTAVSEVISGGT